MIEHELGINHSPIENERRKDLTILQTKLADVLQTTMTEPEGLALTQAPLTIVSRRNGDNEEFIALIDHPLGQISLNSFLIRTSNDKFTPSIGGVIDDWEMPDRATVEKEGEYVRLQRIHLYLGESWKTFEEHRRDFMDAIDEKAEQRLAPQIRTSRFFSEEQLPATIHVIFKFDKRKALQSFLVATEGLGKAELLQLLRESRLNNGLTKRERTMKVEKLKRKLFSRTRLSPQYAERFYQTNLWQAVAENLLTSNFQAHEFPVAEGKNINIYKEKALEPKTARPYLKETFTSSTLGRAVDIPYELVYENGRIFYRKIVEELSFLVPVIHWTNQGGVRKLQASHNNNGSLMQDVVEQLPELSALQPKANSLLGLLAVAYFSPDVRTSWPERMRLPESGRDQFIGPAQIPVLAHIRRRELETAPFLPSLEDVVHLRGELA